MSDRLLKRTPVYEVARRAGAVFAVVSGWQVVEAFADERPDRFPKPARSALVDRSARAKVLVEGQAAANVVERAWRLPGIPVNGGAPFDKGVAYRLRQDRYFLSGPPHAEAQLLAAAEAALRPEDGLVAITAVSQGYAELWLVGQAAADLLSRLCGLDFQPQQFPNHTARESSVAKTKQLVIRADLGQCTAYAIIGGRSFGAYMWQTVVEAAGDLNLQIRGERWLQAMQTEQEGDAAP